MCVHERVCGFFYDVSTGFYGNNLLSSYYSTNNRSTSPFSTAKHTHPARVHETYFMYSKTFICTSLSHMCICNCALHACHNLKYLPFAPVCSHCVHTPFLCQDNKMAGLQREWQVNKVQLSQTGERHTSTLRLV